MFVYVFVGWLVFFSALIQIFLSLLTGNFLILDNTLITQK